MIAISQNLTNVNYNTGSGTGRIKYIVIHYTGNNGDTALANTNYFKSVYRGASAHYFVDESSIWQCVEDRDVAWHCGTSDGYKHASCRNDNSIGIEMCSRRESSGSFYFKDDTVANAVWLTKTLMKKYGVPPENVIRHYDVTGKICPEPYVRSIAAFNDFKSQLIKSEEEVDMTEAQVKKIITDTVNGAVASLTAKLDDIATTAAKEATRSYFEEERAKPPSDWAKDYWAAAVEAGVFDGTMPRSQLTREQAATVFSKLGLLDMNNRE